MSNYQVFIDENSHYQDEKERYKHGDFEGWEVAIAACKTIVDDFLLHNYKPGMEAEDLYQLYTLFGEDPFIGPDNPLSPFSAWEYARQRCQEICSA